MLEYNILWKCFVFSKFSNPSWFEILYVNKNNKRGCFTVKSILKIPIDKVSFSMFIKGKLNSRKYRFIKNIYGGIWYGKETSIVSWII